MAGPLDRGAALGSAALGAARRSTQEAAPWVRIGARVGYAAKGLVYVLVGLLAARAALGQRGSPGDPGDALGMLLGQPLGRALLGIVAVGLFAYALWRLICAVADTERKGTDGKGIVARLGYGWSSFAHGVLGWEAARLALGGASDGGGGGGGGGGQAEHWTARALEAPAGQWLVGLAAAIIAGFALYQLYVAASDRIEKHLDLHELDAGSAAWAVRAGRVGVAARGIVFLVVAWLVLRAALAARAEEAGGLREALAWLGQPGTGQWVLVSVGVGLVAYGIFQFVNARYRRIAM